MLIVNPQHLCFRPLSSHAAESPRSRIEINANTPVHAENLLSTEEKFGKHSAPSLRNSSMKKGPAPVMDSSESPSTPAKQVNVCFPLASPKYLHCLPIALHLHRSETKQRALWSLITSTSGKQWFNNTPGQRKQNEHRKNTMGRILSSFYLETVERTSEVAPPGALWLLCDWSLGSPPTEWQQRTD